VTRPYIVDQQPVVKHQLPGTEEWVRQATQHSNGALWNNGTWVMRDIKGKPGQTSNHARGLAMDLSYRYMLPRNLGTTDGRAKSQQFIRTVLANWEQLGVQLIIDYFPQPFGRSWRCDRAAWRKASKPTFTGAPGGDWWHLEIHPDWGNDPGRVRKAFAAAFTTNPTEVAKVETDN
jgi:hypothetical protein